MRLKIYLNGDVEIGYDAYPLMTRLVNKLIGYNNSEHGKRSNFSFSKIYNVRIVNNTIYTKEGSYFYISSSDSGLLIKIINNIKGSKNETLLFKVTAVDLINDIEFIKGQEYKMIMGSPLLLRDKQRNLLIGDAEINNVILLRTKNYLKNNNLDSDDFSISIDDASNNRIKMITYKGIKNKVNKCNLIVKGNNEQLNFIFNNGVGESTGIGLGFIEDILCI